MEEGNISDDLRRVFRENGCRISRSAHIVESASSALLEMWEIQDRIYEYTIRKIDNNLKVKRYGRLELMSKGFYILLFIAMLIFLLPLLVSRLFTVSNVGKETETVTVGYMTQYIPSNILPEK